MTRLGFLIALLLLLLLSAAPGRCEEKYFYRGAVGVQYGLWKPSSLDSDAADLFKRIQGSTDALGLFVVSPSWNAIALRLQAFQWCIANPPHLAAGEKVALWHIAAEVKQQILSTTAISPYVTFGLSWVCGRHEPGDGDSTMRRVRTTGLDVGTGIDLQIIPHLAVAIEYQYLYVKLDQLLGPTDDYSGSFLVFRIAYLF